MEEAAFDGKWASSLIDCPSEVALDLFATFTNLGFLFLQELVQACHLMQQSLFLVLVSFRFRARQPILADVFPDHLLEFRLQLIPVLATYSSARIY